VNDADKTGESPVVDEFAPPPDAGDYRPWPPASRAPATARARWRLIGLLVGGVAGSLLLAVGCAAGLTYAVRSTDPDLSQPTNAATFPEVTAEPFSGVYPVPQDLCRSADFSGLSALFYLASGTASSARTDAATSATVATCQGTTGNEQVQGDFLMEVSVFRDVVTATRAFDRGRTRDASDIDIGQGGYTSVDPVRGLLVTARDYNVTISMSWRPADPAASEQLFVPEKVLLMLADVCRSSLHVLRVG
jgi:hypothetical protein